MYNTKIISHNIISSLGFDSDENYRNVVKGETGIKILQDMYDLQGQVAIGTIDKDRLDHSFFTTLKESPNNYPVAEKMALLSSYNAINQSNIDTSSTKTIFIVSTTKGNVDLIGNTSTSQDDNIFLWDTARKISNYFHNPNEPVVVSNACISGLAAQIVASRLLNSGLYDTAVIIGVDALSKFVITGFQSFKALSTTYCRPFDKDRVGLNLGEGAATIVVKTVKDNELCADDVCYVAGALANDANHISGPSRTGEGLYLAMQQTIKQTHHFPHILDNEDVSFINAHGTATLYNDEMESIAITRCNFNEIPVISLKGYFGHTLGCAGVLETIISCMSLQHNTLLKSMYFENCGTTNSININTLVQNIELHSFMKTISGFGGCNACALFSKIQ